MGMSFNGLSGAAVTVTNLSKQTGVPAATSRTSAGTTAIGTVPASKVWRVLAVWAYIDLAATASQCYTQIQLNGVVALEVGVINAAASSDSANNNITFDYSACPVLTAGQVVNLVCTNGCNRTAGGIIYVEESA